MAGRPGYTVEKARADARKWIKGTTIHNGSRGWRVCAAILDERIGELEAELKTAADTRCLIWSHEHGAWWGPCRNGYTADIRRAGIYSRDEAMRIVADATLDWTRAPNEVVVRLVDMPAEAWG